MPDIHDSLAGGIDKTLDAMREVGKDTAQELRHEQLVAQQQVQHSLSKGFIPRTQAPKKPVKAQKKRVQKSKLATEKGKRFLPIEKVQKKAEEFERRNRELKSKILLMLRQSIDPEDSKEEILKKVQSSYEDVSLADEAIEFLSETTDGELARKVNDVKEEFNKQNGREIRAGRNIATQAREAAARSIARKTRDATDLAVDTPTSLRDLYRDITGNPRDSSTLFDELSKTYNYDELKKVTNFLLHAMGSDMKAKGPSIPRGQLFRLLTETRSLQAILGVYRFFINRMKLVSTLFQKNGLKLPASLNFENMAKAFMELARERYPSSDRVVDQAKKLGIEDRTLEKIITFSQFRDAVREVAMQKIYKSLQHRDELFLAILESLEDLEDTLEEEENAIEDDEWEEGEQLKEGEVT